MSIPKSKRNVGKVIEMLKKLHLKNYAKHKDLELNFSDGLTAICGKNGGGKTLIVDAVSFALFGS